MKWLKTKIKSISLGQHAMGLYYKKEQQFSSFFGGCVSLLFYLLVVVYSLVILSRIFQKSEYVITDTLKEIDYDQLMLENLTLQTVIESMNPTMTSILESNVTCSTSFALLLVVTKDLQSSTFELNCSQQWTVENGLQYSIAYFFLSDREPLFNYSIDYKFIQILCFHCGTEVKFEKTGMYITNNKLATLRNEFPLANNSLYLQTLQLWQINSSDSIFADFVKYLWYQQVIMNSEPLVYFTSLGDDAVGINFNINKIQRIIDYMPQQLFSAISDIGGFASIVGIGTIFIGYIHKKLVQRSLRKRTFKEERDEDLEKSCLKLNWEKVFLTAQSKKRNEQVKKLYSYENMLRIIKRLDALDGGDIEEEIQDAEPLITKIQNDDESLLSL